jgi:hypothetical protein
MYFKLELGLPMYFTEDEHIKLLILKVTHTVYTVFFPMIVHSIFKDFESILKQRNVFSNLHLFLSTVLMYVNLDRKFLPVRGDFLL